MKTSTITIPLDEELGRKLEERMVRLQRCSDATMRHATRNVGTHNVHIVCNAVHVASNARAWSKRTRLIELIRHAAKPLR